MHQFSEESTHKISAITNIGDAKGELFIIVQARTCTFYSTASLRGGKVLNGVEGCMVRTLISNPTVNDVLTQMQN